MHPLMHLRKLHGLKKPQTNVNIVIIQSSNWPVKSAASASKIKIQTLRVHGDVIINASSHAVDLRKFHGPVKSAASTSQTKI